MTDHNHPEDRPSGLGRDGPPVTEAPRSVTGGQVPQDWAALRAGMSKALRPVTFAFPRPTPSNKVILRVGKRGLVALQAHEARELAAQLIRSANDIEQRGGDTPRSQA